MVERSEMGQGVITGLAMLAAEEMEIALDRIRVEFTPVAFPGARAERMDLRLLARRNAAADPLGPIRLERDRAAGLGDKLAAVLWQLPRDFHRNLERLEGFARALAAWRRPRHAIEFRHPSYWPPRDAVTTDRNAARLLALVSRSR
jgi:hypothetical protein